MTTKDSWHAEDVAAGSHIVRVYLDGSYPDAYTTVCTFSPYRDGALVCGCHGTVNRRVVAQWVDYATRYGWEFVYFCRPSGKSFRKFAVFDHADNGFDFYKIEVKRL